MKNVNARYIKNNPNIYIKELENILFKKFGKCVLPLKEILPSENIAIRTKLVFSNISFPERNRSFSVPVIDESTIFVNTIMALHNQCHEMVKLAKKNKK